LPIINNIIVTLLKIFKYINHRNILKGDYMKSLNVDELKTVITASILIIIGLLFCCSLSMGISGLSVIIGLIVIILGALFMLNSIFSNNGLISAGGLGGIFIISFGITFISSNLAVIIFAYIPWLLVVFGTTLTLDGLLAKFWRKENNSFDFILKLVVGIVSVVLGLCLMIIEGFMEYSSIVLGILLIVYGIYIIFTQFINKKPTTPTPIQQ
jgi:uncharacterized membrane protein HdeD (DUF308 family)